MDESLGPHEKHFRATLGRLVACRWLRPDAEMETLSPAALDWLNDRIDEFRAALGPFVKAPETIAPITLVTERSATGAFARWTAAWDDHVLRSPLEKALENADFRTAVSPLVTLGRPAESVIAWLHKELAVTCEAPSPWSEVCARYAWECARDGLQPGLMADRAAHPAVLTAVQHLRWALAVGNDPSAPSPWEPFVAIYERGAWPMFLPDDVVQVYVPVLRGATLVPEPDAPERQRFPRRLPVPERLSRRLPMLERCGLSTPPSMPVPLRKSPSKTP